MAIVLVLDQGIPRDAAVRLREFGYECLHVGEVGMSTAVDEEILGFALGRRAVVVTLDADFHAILAVSGAPGHRSSAFGSRGSVPPKLPNAFAPCASDSIANSTPAIW